MVLLSGQLVAYLVPVCSSVELNTCCFEALPPHGIGRLYVLTNVSLRAPAGIALSKSDTDAAMSLGIP